jgi:excisionase family DNA binding protein
VSQLTRRARAWWASLVAGPCCVLALTTVASAQTSPTCAPVLTLTEAADLLRVHPDELAQLAQQGGVPGRRIGSAWRFGCAALLEWLKGEPRPDGSLTSAALRETTARGTAGGQGTQPPPPATAPAPEPPPDQAAIGEAPEEPTAEDVFLRGQRVLLGRGDVVMDVGQFYSRRDALQLAATAADGVGLATIEQRAMCSR